MASVVAGERTVGRDRCGDHLVLNRSIMSVKKPGPLYAMKGRAFYWAFFTSCRVNEWSVARPSALFQLPAEPPDALLYISGGPRRGRMDSKSPAKSPDSPPVSPCRRYVRRSPDSH